jgi:CRISPR/Cas system-associated endonuclease Cas3-HD
LRDHHSWVAQVCKDQGRSETEKHFLWLVGVFHDAGKYSSIFQYYMACNGNVIDTLEVQQLVKDYKQHAIYGAYMYVWRVSQNIGTYIQNGLSKEEIKHYIIA